MSDFGRSGKGRRKKRSKETVGFKPKANAYLNPQRGRDVQPTLPPPKHLPFNIVQPQSTKYNPKQDEFSKPSPAVAMNTWNEPDPGYGTPQPFGSGTQFGSTPQPYGSNHQQFGSQHQQPKRSIPKPPNVPALPPKPPNTKPVSSRNVRNGRLQQQPVISMAPPRHLPTNIIPPESVIIPRSRPHTRVQQDIPEFGSMAQAFVSGDEYSSKNNRKPSRKDMELLTPRNYQNKKKVAPLPALPKLELPTVNKNFGNGSVKKKKKRRKKKLNKYKSSDAVKKPQYIPPTFKPIPNLPPKPAPPTPERRGRARESSKNAHSAFFGVASREANDLRFDSAMEKVKMKMDRKKSRAEMFPQVQAKPRSREKSRVVQQKLQNQFGFFQSKFSHKGKQQPRGQNRNGQNIPSLPPRRRNGQQNTMAGLF